MFPVPSDAELAQWNGVNPPLVEADHHLLIWRVGAYTG